MSNKTEFKNVLITNINYSKDGNFAFFTIEDNRTFNNNTRIHKFNITARADALKGVQPGKRVIIDASLISKEYEYNNQIKTSWSIWANKVYCLEILSESIDKPGYKATTEQQTGLPIDIPFLASEKNYDE